MRNLIRADLRRVFRKQIYWIIPTVIMFYLFSQVIANLLIQHITKFVPILALMENSDNTALSMFGKTLETLNFAVAIVIFVALFSEDFKSMTMIGMIGYGMSRKKIVLTKFIDSVILSAIFYLVLTPIIFILFAAFGRPLTGDFAMYAFLQILFSVFKTVANITIASLALYVSNNIPLGIFAVLVLQIIPIGLSMMNTSQIVATLHLDRYYIDGLFNMALTDFILGLYPEGLLKICIAVMIYIVAILVGILLYFDKKELDF
ncbi:MAG: hypothetical protein IKO32_07805 [Lachnospiraceae bacterium]|nr:hypothetical protein [Lachnospiraceae bacterium]